MSMRKRVPAMLNYSAGADGLRSACVAAGITNIMASRTFLEKAKITAIVQDIPGVKIHYLEDLKGLISPTDKLWILLAHVSSEGRRSQNYTG